MRDPLAPFVAARGAAVLDGGLATELEARGLDLRDPLWSARALLEAPELVEAIHRDYLEAGADVITTATYQATLPGLAARGLTADAARGVLVSGVAIALRARDAFSRGKERARPRPLVAASIGSYGAFLADGSEYRGAYGLDADALCGWHRPRVRILEGSGADLLAFETIPSLIEVEAIVELLGEAEGPPAWVSLQTRDGARLADGSGIAPAAALLAASPRAFACGVNCVPPESVAEVLETLSGLTSKPLVAYPNRGDAWDAVRRRWIPRPGVADLGPHVSAWRAAGARLIGGCCRTTPDDIRAIAAAL